MAIWLSGWLSSRAEVSDDQKDRAVGSAPDQPKPPNRGDKESGEVYATAPQVEETRVNFSTRIKSSTRRRVRVYAAAHDLDLQDVVDQALEEYLRRHDG